MSDQNQNREQIAELVFKYLLRQLSEDEQAGLDQWIAASPENQAEFQVLTDRARLKLRMEDYNQVANERIWKKIVNDVPELTAARVKQNKYVWFRVSIAAAVLVALLLGGWLFLTRSFKKSDSQQAVTTTKDISPGGNKAILILGDGTKLVLDSAQHGVLAQQGKTSISKKREGEVIYNANLPAGQAGSPLTYNTITTPRGGQYHVVLPDGSHVWLNAASSIHFPIQFTEKERKVTVSGEAYFEVAKDKTKPFKVMVSPDGNELCEITVLGTHFNVSGYTNESYANATLLEGSINFTVNSENNKQNVKLQPGQQASVKKGNNNVSVINDENAESAILWVKGIFHFEKNNLSSVMRQLSRWYDVDVVYEGVIPEQKITGDAERDIPLSIMLQTLEQMTSVHFKVQGRTVKVTP
jgi:transmembrane sensor